MQEDLLQAIANAASKYTHDLPDIELSFVDELKGDYSTNIALKLAAKTKKNPRELAQIIAGDIKVELGTRLESVTVAGPGFINIILSDEELMGLINSKPKLPLAGQVIVVEYSDPNPFKLLHAGHLYTSIVGDAIANLLSASGALVYRVNYGGDVGLHVGKTIWAMIKELDGELPEKLTSIKKNERSAWMSHAYVLGTDAYEKDEQAKTEIIEYNKKVYAIHQNKDYTTPLAQIYWTTREWSYEALDDFYQKLNIKFDKYYPESEAMPIGMDIVSKQLDAGVFTKSEGAIVFKGEDFGLHTRVFINSHGLPTYEAKELGLFQLKLRDYKYDRSIVITGNEQEQYMKVVLKALEQFMPELADTNEYLGHGMVRLSGGKKMSSRLGNILTAEDVIVSAEKATKEVSGKYDERVVLAAIKYSMLKQRMGGDIIYDPEESVSVLGNSGPYLQYSYARAKSIMAKIDKISKIDENISFEAGERTLVNKLARYNRVVEQTAAELSPNILCTYLYELAQEFSRFYEKNRVIGDKRENIRLMLISIYADRLKGGLELLGIASPERL